MAAAQHKLSRRTLLAGACAVPALRHPELVPGSSWSPAGEVENWLLKQVQHDGSALHDRWQKAAALYARAEAGLEALAHTLDDNLYDRVLGRHNAALARLLRTPAPDLAAVARKLDLVLAHQVFELSFAEPCLAALRRDAWRFARANESGASPQTFWLFVQKRAASC
jgi:hypothetical protein